MSSSTSTTANSTENEDTASTPYEVQERDILFSSNTRYLVTVFKGEGCFGKVAKCVNLKSGKHVAVKIHKENDEDSIQNEVEMLKAIRTLDPDKSNIVRFFEGFRFQNLSCLTFEMLDKSLLDLMREQQRTMHLNEIRPIAHQLLVALDALKSIGILHTDLKPDNIMFINHKDHPFKLKLIDFGLAQRVSEMQVGKIIQPRSYRAPEVALGLPLSEAMDMWGVGCILAFMYFGANLLPNQCPYHWMKTIVHLLGQPEDHLLNAGKYTSRYFIKKDDGSPGWRLKSSDEYEETTGAKVEIRRRIFDYAENLDDAVRSYPQERKDVEYKDRMAFLSLLKTCLNLDPQLRATPREAMMNPFISMVHLVDGMATSSYADEALQIMYNSHLKHLVESDDSLSDSSMDSGYCSLRLAGAGSLPENSSAEEADIESHGDGDTDGEDYRSEDEDTEKDRSSDTDSCSKDLFNDNYDADCSDDSSTDGDTHTSADNANVESSADEDVIQPSSMRCSDSLPFTDEDNIVPVYSNPSGGDADSLPPTTSLCGEDIPSSSNGHPEGEMFNLDMSAGLSAISSCHDGVSERSSLSYKECGGAPTSAHVHAVTDCGPIAREDEVSPAVDPTDGAAATMSTNDGAAAATQPAVQRKKFRNVRKFFSRLRRRVVSFFNN